MRRTLVGGVPTRAGLKHLASLIFVLNHEAAGKDMNDVALSAPMVRLEPSTVSDKAYPDVPQILSARRGGPRFAVLDNCRNGRPIDGADGYMLYLHSFIRWLFALLWIDFLKADACMTSIEILRVLNFGSS
jgi:hypothetical protein